MPQTKKINTYRTLSPAENIAQEWMQKADEALAKVHLLKQVNFPPLFNQFEFVAANPVTSIENTFADYWSVTFQVFLQTGLRTGGKSNVKVPLQGSFMELMLGTNGRIIGLEYNYLPIKKSQKSNLFNLLPETQEPATGTGAVLQTRSPNTGQAPPPTQEIQKLPPQELPQIVYNLNPDTGIIAPYFLSTKGGVPACKEANRVRRVKIVSPTQEEKGMSEFDTPRGFRVVKTLFQAQPRIYDLTISANILVYSDQLNLQQLQNFCNPQMPQANGNLGMQANLQQIFGTLPNSTNDDGNILYRYTFQFTVIPVPAVGAFAAGTVNAALINANTNTQTRGDLINNYFYVYQNLINHAFNGATPAYSLGGNSGIMWAGAPVITQAHEVLHMMGYCYDESDNLKASGNNDWSHNFRNPVSIMRGAPPPGTASTRIAQVTGNTINHLNYGSGIPHSYNNRPDRYFGLYPTNYIYSQIANNNILGVASQIFPPPSIPPSQLSTRLVPIQSNIPDAIGADINWSTIGVFPSNGRHFGYKFTEADKIGKRLGIWAQAMSRKYLILSFLIFFFSLHAITFAQDTNTYTNDYFGRGISTIPISVGYPNESYVLFSSKEIKENKIKSLSISLQNGNGMKLPKNIYECNYNLLNKKVSETSYGIMFEDGIQLEDREYKKYFYSNTDFPDSIVKILSFKYETKIDYLSINTLNRQGRYITQSYSPKVVIHIYDTLSLNDIQNNFTKIIRAEKVISSKTRFGKRTEIRVRYRNYNNQLDEIYPFFWTDTFVVKYNKKGLKTHEIRSVPATESIMRSGHRSFAGANSQKLKTHYFYNDKNKLIKINREYISSYKRTHKLNKEETIIILERKDIKKDTVSDYFIYNKQDSLIKETVHRIHYSNRTPILINDNELVYEIIPYPVVTEQQFDKNNNLSEKSYKSEFEKKEWYYSYLCDKNNRRVQEIYSNPTKKEGHTDSYNYSENSYSQTSSYYYHSDKKGKVSGKKTDYSVIRNDKEIIEYYGNDERVIITQIMEGTETIPVKRTFYFLNLEYPMIIEHIFTYEYFK